MVVKHFDVCRKASLGSQTFRCLSEGHFRQSLVDMSKFHHPNGFHIAREGAWRVCTSFVPRFCSQVAGSRVSIKRGRDLPGPPAKGGPLVIGILTSWDHNLGSMYPFLMIRKPLDSSRRALFNGFRIIKNGYIEPKL